jgi:hypothetical protein
MRFTEHELTVAVTAAAKTVAGAKRRRTSADEAWEAMSKLDRYHLVSAVGDEVLPVLLALPDVDVEPGTRPTFTDAQVAAAVEDNLGDAGGRLRRKVAVAARTTLVKVALAALPVRQDPDALVVPDSL